MSKDNNNNKKKKTYKQQAFGSFSGFTAKTTTTHKGKAMVVDIKMPKTSDGGFKNEELCCPGCFKDFINIQGLASHKNSCKSFERFKDSQSSDQPKKRQITLEVDIPQADKAKLLKRAQSEEIRAVLKKTSSGNQEDEIDDATDEEEGPQDGRKANRGSAQRNRYTNSVKAGIIDKFEAWKQDNSNPTVLGFVKQFGYTNKFRTFLTAGQRGWLNPQTKEKIYKNAAQEQFKQFKVAQGSRKASKWPLMEHELFRIFAERRRRGAKVSSTFLRLKAKLLMQKHYPDEASTFKASDGWLANFKARRNIKFRKRKNKKKQNLEEKRHKVSDIATKQNKKYFILSSYFVFHTLHRL